MKAILMQHDPEPERVEPHPWRPHSRAAALAQVLMVVLIAVYFVLCWSGAQP
ncbi:hypothetical protein [Nocardia altamirensis]|uniref:hypothetical protein n=1 Tax=Nocardia altamirensis TaxID=472158 RepID=UPI00143556F3|nr:hypothetical protein [Nocardia altamirensis]